MGYVNLFSSGFTFVLFMGLFDGRKGGKTKYSVIVYRNHVLVCNLREIVVEIFQYSEPLYN